jgi:UDP-glucose 4-epimerase
LSGKTVAITGAAGFLGARATARLASEDCTIIRVARSRQRPIGNAAADVIDVTGDVSEREVWDRIVDADVILHFAGQTSVAAAAADPEADFLANVMPIRNLRAACRDRRRHPIVVFAGTVTQAGIPARLPVNEDIADDPITVYDRHKLIAEKALKEIAAAGIVCGATLRLANVYGPGANGRRADRDVLNRMIAAAMIGEPLTVYGTGEYLRDYVFVDDVVDAFLAAAEHSDRVNARHFVIGSGRGINIREAFALIAERVEAKTGRHVAVIAAEPPAPLAPIDRRNFIADSSRFSEATGWRPSRGLADGIDLTIEALTCA